jgi:tetratricopeptide (TPR) repeat protein
VETYRTAVRILENTYGSRHVHVAWAYYNLGTGLERAGELDQAADAYARSLDANIPVDVHAGMAWQGLAVVEQQRGRPVAADSAWSRAVEVYTAHESAWAAVARLALARNRLARGAYQEAEPVVREALTQAKESGDREQELAATGLLVELFSATGRADSATVYRAREEGLQDTPGAPTPAAPDDSDPVSGSG